MLQPIGVFDSGFGGLTILKELVKRLPQYDFVYLGDNARAPYGSRSFDTVHRYTWECVQWFFKMNCPLVILACNTASAKALRTIQQTDLPRSAPDKKVLGVIRPTTEIIGNITQTGSVGILATPGTVSSESYPVEINRFFPNVTVYQEACPMWVPLIENNEHESEGADYFVRKHLTALLEKSPQIDTMLLACTHYPLLSASIRKCIPDHIRVVTQGEIIASSLEDYLMRHSEIEGLCSKNGTRMFFTTDSPEEFNRKAAVFYGDKVESENVQI